METEVLTPWDEVDGVWQYYIVSMFVDKYKSAGYKVTVALMKRLFALAKPRVTIGPTYWRIDKENSEVLQLLIREYVDK